MTLTSIPVKNWFVGILLTGKVIETIRAFFDEYPDNGGIVSSVEIVDDLR